MAGAPTGDSFIQIVQPRTGTKDYAGWCLRHTQSVFGAEPDYPSAKAASNATQFRHYTRELPNTAAILWFDHWGNYDDTYSKNWGHVAVWVPGHGILTSPWYVDYGQEWYPSIDAIERTFGAKFLFWSEDINRLRVTAPAQPTVPAPIPLPRKGKKMFLCFHNDPFGDGKPAWAFYAGDFWHVLRVKETVVQLKDQIGMTADSFNCGSVANWRRFHVDSHGDECTKVKCIGVIEE